MIMIWTTRLGLFGVVAPCRPELVLTVLDGLDIRIPRNISRFLKEQQHAHFLECRYRDARNFLQVRYNNGLLLWKGGIEEEVKEKN